MKYISFILLSILITACASHRIAKQEKNVSDSTRIEVRYGTVYVTDTVTIEIPKEVERIVTHDTISRLENSFALSEARYVGGLLYHSLETKPQQKPVAVQKQIEYRDSIVYRDKQVEVKTPVTIEKPLTWWQKVRLNGFWALLALCVWNYRNILARISSAVISFIKKIL